MYARARGAHPLLDVLLAAASGVFPPVDGRVVFMPPLKRGLETVLCLTGRAYAATRLSPDDLADLRLDGFGGALAPAVLARLAGAEGEVGVLDATLVNQGVGGGRLPVRSDLDDHPRVRHARALREDVRVHGDERGVVTLARGLAGRTELSVEVAVDQRGRGVGRGLIQEALGLVPAGQPVFAAVSPGNARSLRAFTAVGFAPLGSEVLVRPVGGSRT